MKSYPRKQVMTKTQKFAEGGKVAVQNKRDVGKYGAAAQINPSGMTGDEVMARARAAGEQYVKSRGKSSLEAESMLAIAAGTQDSREKLKRRGQRYEED